MTLRFRDDLISHPVASPQATLGEGPVWHDDRLWFVDIDGCTLNALGDDGSIETWHAGQRIGFAAPTTRGDWIVGLQHGLARWNPALGIPAIFHDPEPERPDNRFNDGKADPAGRLFAGTLKLPCDEPVASLYRLDTDLSVSTVRERVTISNGLAWDAARRAMYYIDTPTQTVTRYDWDPASSEVKNPSALIRFDPTLGSPDGMTIDADGRLWVAMWGGSAVLCVDPEQRAIVRRISVEAPHVTSCCFGGPGLETLFITSARVGLSPDRLAESPRSGDIFAVTPGVSGLPVDLFRG